MSLPSGYKRLEYIQSTGTQYIDTLFKPNSNTKFVVDLQISNNMCHVFGARTSYLKKALCLFWKSNSAWAIQVGNTQFNAGAFDETARHKVTMTATELYMDGNLQKSYSTDYFQCEQNAWLMSCYSSSASEYASGKLYSCQIYDNGTIIRDYIPAKLSDGTVGLYDKLSGLLYINAGTGTFEAGPSSLNLPVNIGGTWKDANEVFVNIGGTWKTVEAAFVNIGGTWKELG